MRKLFRIEPSWLLAGSSQAPPERSTVRWLSQAGQQERFRMTAALCASRQRVEGRWREVRPSQSPALAGYPLSAVRNPMFAVRDRRDVRLCRYSHACRMQTSGQAALPVQSRTLLLSAVQIWEKKSDRDAARRSSTPGELEGGVLRRLLHDSGNTGKDGESFLYMEVSMVRDSYRWLMAG